MRPPQPPPAGLRRHIRYLAGRVLVSQASRLPRPLGLALGAALGRAGHVLVGRDRGIAEANLRAAFPDWSEARVRAEAGRVFRELGRNIFDVAACARWSEDERRRRLDVEGLEHLRHALSAGRGAILFGAHQGAWELVAVALAGRGIDVTGVARPIREARLDAWLAGHRRKLGISTIAAGGLPGARDMCRVLAQGRVIGLLLDHRIRRGGVVADFFGRPARFAAGPARLSLRCGAPLVPVQIMRRPDGGHRVMIHPARPMPAADLPPREGAGRLMRDAVAALESMIRRDPSAWAWIHPRWGRPEAAGRTAWAAQPSRATTVLGLMALALLAAAGCGEGGGNTSEGVSSGTASSTLSGITVRETLDGMLRWILRADSSETDQQQSQTVIKRLHVDFYDPDGTVTSVLTSDEGTILRNTNDMTAHGHVRLVSARGETLTTESLDWNNAAGRITTRDPFRLARPDGWLTGVGFESDPGLKSYTTTDVQIDSRSDDSQRR